MKICYIIQNLHIGGIPTFLLNLSKKIAHKYKLSFVATEDRNIHPGFYNLGQAHYVEAKNIVGFLKDLAPDIVQYGNLDRYREAALEAKVPFVIERTAGPRSCGLSKSGVNHVVSSSKGTVPIIRKFYNGPITIIYNGVDIGHLNSFPTDRCGFDESDFLVCYCARMGGVGQGFQHLIAATVEARKKNKKIKLVLIGDVPGDSAEDIKDYLYRLAKPLGDNCVFAGESSEPYGIISGANLCCSPAAHHGISNFLIESSALKRPLLATNVGQTNEILSDNLSGILIPYDKKIVTCLTEKILYLSTRPDLCKQLGEYGAEIVSQNFDIIKQSEKYIRLYDNCFK